MNTVLRANGRIEFSAGKGQYVLDVNKLKRKGAKWPDVQRRLWRFKEQDQEKIKSILDIILWN